MRTIKFRAKGIYNKKDWSYGLLRSVREDGTGYLDEESKKGIRIKLDTLGQYIGVKDANNQEIYEGDIVQLEYCIDGCLYYAEDYPGLIVWDKNDAAFKIDFRNEYSATLLSEYCKIEVIGNIYDNPELLK